MVHYWRMTDPVGQHEPVVIRERIAANVRAELARARTPANSLVEILGLHRNNAARRYAGEVPYFAYEIVLLAVVLDIPAGRLLNCDPFPAPNLPAPPDHVLIRRHIQEQDDMNTRPAGADQ